MHTSQLATPLVVVPKANDKIRVCSDYKVIISKCVETKTYPLPTIGDIGKACRRLSELDLTQAYQQLPLDQDSKEFLVVKYLI